MNDDTLLAELLEIWEKAERNGDVVSAEEICSNRPELLRRLKRQIESLQSAAPRDKTRPSGGSSTELNLPASDDPLEAAELSPVTAVSNLRFHRAGGLGALYRGRDRALHRDIAVKLIQDKVADDAGSRERFLLEAEVTGRLEHPGVVPVYGVGQTEDGRPFYLMRFIEGRSLEQAIEQLHGAGAGRQRVEWNLAYRRLLHQFVAVCKTIAYAHNRGIIHRDIKPDNIMLGRYGETIVIDWGLAMSVGRSTEFKVSGEKTLLPESGSSEEGSGGGGGTPNFMSPEQFDRDAVLGPATDIYSLGVTLYKILTGDHPFHAESYHELKARVQSGNPERPRGKKPLVSPAIEAVCLKAMATRPLDRYPTAVDLAADVERYLSDEAVSAYEEPLSRKAARWARRHRGMVRGLVAGTAGLILVAVASAVALSLVTAGAIEDRKSAEAAERSAIEAKEATLRLLADKTSQLMAYEMERRWETLRRIAEEPRLREQLARVNALHRLADDPQAPRAEIRQQAQAAREDIQNFLNANYINAHQRAQNWFVNDLRGFQIARSPRAADHDTVGMNFAYRDYFHGQGRDLPKGAEAEPMTDALHLSAIVKSEAKDGYKVMFSVPVWSGTPHAQDSEVIGILGMGVLLGQFQVLDPGEEYDEQYAIVLVDTRADYLEAAGQGERESRKGLVLHHPDLLSEAVGASNTDALHRLPAPLVQQMERSLARADKPQATLLRDYRDPLANGQSECDAAYAPIIYNEWFSSGESRRLLLSRNLGWFVLVHERAALPDTVRP